MPTNLLRQARKTTTTQSIAQVTSPAPERLVEIRVGQAVIRARLLDTPTADRIWQALPIFSSIEIWGQEIHFETEVESGRERGARVLVNIGDIAWVPEQDWVSIIYGPTPTSKKGELRLWSPANIWAHALDDVTVLRAARPGEKVSVQAVEAKRPAGMPTLG
jgi:uncharacterized protein